MENPPKKYFRLSPGQLVRLKSAYIIRCEEVIKDPQGLITEIRCAYIAESKSGSDTSGISVKGTLHWVSVSHAVKAEVRMYDRLFNVEDPTDESQDFLHYLNPSSLTVLPQVMAEPSLLETKSGDRYQFVRKGYFVLDKDSQPTHLVFNKTVGLKDGWNPAKG